MFCVGFLLFFMLFLLFFIFSVCKGSFFCNPVSLSRRSGSPGRIPHALHSSASAYVLLWAEGFLPLNRVCQVLHIYPVPACDTEEDGSCLRPEGCCKSCDRLDFFHRIIKCGDHRNADHQPGFSVERNPSCILQHQSVGSSCEFFMFFLIHMLDIHQIYIQIGKYLFDLFPWAQAILSTLC